MKVFVLNLARCTERMARVKARLDELGVPFERLEGIDDTLMDETAKRRSVSRLGWWCCSLRPITRGQIGCTLSHQLAYRRMLAEGLDRACVLEDDVVLDDRFPAVLRALEQALDASRPQVALMCDHADGRMKILAEARAFSLDRVDEAMYAEGYVLTRLAAEQILEANFPLRVMDDIWGRWVRQGRIELYLARPTVCTQTSPVAGDSTIVSASVLRERMSVLGKLGWDLRRLAGILLDACTGWPEMKGSLVLLGRFLKGGR